MGLLCPSGPGVDGTGEWGLQIAKRQARVSLGGKACFSCRVLWYGWCRHLSGGSHTEPVTPAFPLEPLGF